MIKVELSALTLRPYQSVLTTGQVRSGVILKIVDQTGKTGYGDVSPLPNFSLETLEEAMSQIEQKKQHIVSTNWSTPQWMQDLSDLNLYPSVNFGLESALLSLTHPLEEINVPTSALLMGSLTEILKQANQRLAEGFTSAKLKVSQLSFEEAAQLINQLKNKMNLRIDVNRAWETKQSLEFFSQFPQDTFEYVEEPFNNPHDLYLFTHPLAVDESYPSILSLTDLEQLKNLKAVIYKPTLQGGIANCLELQTWTQQKNIKFILSSSFESDIGLSHIALMSHRLGLNHPIGIGTYPYLTHYLSQNPLLFIRERIYCSTQMNLKREIQ